MIYPYIKDLLLGNEEVDRVKAYFDSPAVNNSTLSQVFNPRWIEWKLQNREVEDQDKRVYRIGSAVDCLLTDPERYSKEFFIFSESKPSGLMGKFIDAIKIDVLTETEDPLQIAEIETAFKIAYEISGYKKSYAAVKSAFLGDEKFCAYHRARMLSKGRTIISTDEMTEVECAVNSIKEVGILREYFNLNKPIGIETILQCPIYFEYKGLQCKALLDGLVIDHTKKLIMPFDLKTTGSSVMEFSESFWKYGYYRQFAFYTIGLHQNPHTLELLNQGYRIGYPERHGFVAIVAPKKENSGDGAIAYRVSPEQLRIGLNGGEANFNGKNHKVKGVNELIDCFKWHLQTRIFNCTKWVYDSNYHINIE